MPILKSTIFGPYRVPAPGKIPFSLSLDSGGVGVGKNPLRMMLIAAPVSIKADTGFPSAEQDSIKNSVAILLWISGFGLFCAIAATGTTSEAAKFSFPDVLECRALGILDGRGGVLGLHLEL